MAAPAAAASTEVRRRFCVAATAHPLTVGAAQFNDAMVRALRSRADVRFLSWTRPYPPLLYRGSVRDDASRPPRVEKADFVLDWLDPRTWRQALASAIDFGAEALVLPWLHPVMTPPYLGLLRGAREMTRMVVCHNVLPHERMPFASSLTRRVLQRADVLVTHAPQQLEELRALGVRGRVVEAFHPLFVPEDLAEAPSRAAVEAERARCGDPDLLLLLYGAVRPYKGADLAIEALARVDPALSVRLVVAGRFWTARSELAALADRLGVGHRVELRDGFVSNEETALLFAATDAALLPYRSATQSGVVALSFGHGKPVIATDVGGLPAAVRDGGDGLLVPAGDVDALARAIERMAREHEWLAAGARRTKDERSFERYAALLEAAVA